MKAFILTLATLAAAMSLGSRAEASNVTIDLSPNTNSYAARSVGGKSHCGVISRLCGRQPTSAAVAKGTTVVTQDIIVQCQPQPSYELAPDGTPVTRSPKHKPLRQLVWMLDLNQQHCYPNCYTGTPCSCCDHTMRHIEKGTCEHFIYAALIKTHLKRSHPLP